MIFKGLKSGKPLHVIFVWNQVKCLFVRLIIFNKELKCESIRPAFYMKDNNKGHVIQELIATD